VLDQWQREAFLKQKVKQTPRCIEVQKTRMNVIVSWDKGNIENSELISLKTLKKMYNPGFYV
jgi:hypothetical protein